jgi:cell division protein FtsW
MNQSSTARASMWQAVRGRIGRLLRRDGGVDTGGALPVRDFVNVTSSRPSRMMGFDQSLVWLTLSLLAMGLVMVYSATIALPDSPRFANYTPTFFFTRHIMALTMALAVGAVVTQIPMDTWERAARWLFVISLMLLVIVLIPHVSRWCTVRAVG